MLRQFELVKGRLVSDLSAQCHSTPEFRHLFLPVAGMVQHMPASSVTGESADHSNAVWKQSDDLIHSLLVVAQGVSGSIPAIESKRDEFRHMPSEFARHRDVIQSMHIEDVFRKASSLISSVADELSFQGSSTATPLCLARILPFLETLGDSYAQSLASYASAVKSAYKLSFVVGRVMLDLAQKGFCKPSEESDSSKDGEDGNAVEGTGMGAGTGDKNVSSEIEEEGQVEGLQGEQEEEYEGDGEDRKDEDDTVSMEEDFEGALGEGKENDDQDGSDDGDEKEDIDEHAGDVDPLDPGAVDEKFWGDKDKEDERKNEQKDMTNEKAKQDVGEAELCAKENETEDAAKHDDQRNGRSSPLDTQHDNTDDDVDKDNDEILDEDNEGEDLPAGQDQSEVAMPEGDKLDLPEDLDFGSERDEDQNDLDDDMAMSEGDEEERLEGDEKEEDVAVEDGVDADEAPSASGPAEEESNALEETMNQTLDISPSKEQQQQNSAQLGKGVNESTEQQRPSESDEQTVAEDHEEAEQQSGEA